MIAFKIFLFYNYVKYVDSSKIKSMEQLYLEKLSFYSCPLYSSR